MSGMIRPTRPGTVSLSDSQMAMGSVGMGMRPGMGQPTQQMSGADSIRALLSQGIGNTSTNNSGFNWSNTNNSLYAEEVYKSLQGNNTENTDSLAYYIELVAPGMAVFVNQICARLMGGLIFEEFKKIRDNYRLNPNTMQVDEILSAFIDDVNKHPEFNRIIGMHGAPFFGQQLIDILRTSNRQGLDTGDYLSATHGAVRNVLFFELVSWLTKSSRGQMYTHNLPKYIMAKIADLDKYKEYASKIYDMFGQTFPYAGLEFKRPQSTRPDFSMLYGNIGGYELGTLDAHRASAGDYQTFTPPQDDQYREVYEMVARNAAARKQQQYGYAQQSTAPKVKETVDGAITDWNVVRKDYENLTPANRNEFNVRRFFRPTGRKNHYLVLDTEWRKIKHAYPKHPEMGVEETLLPGCFRIVVIDLDTDEGWFSHIVRTKMDAAMVVSNPAKLLPYLDNPEDMSQFTIRPVKLEDVGDKENFTIEVETCRELEKDIPLVVVEDEIVSQSSKDIETTIRNANQSVSKNFKEENATGFKVTNWDTFTCHSPEDKIRLFQDLPFLFKDGYVDTQKSFFQICREVSGFIGDNIVNSDVMEFITERLTTTFNEWLVNQMGYDADPSGDNHLSTSDIIEDFREMSEHLKEHDEVAYHDFHDKGSNNYLVNAAQIFTFKHPEKEGEELTNLEKLQQEVDLVVSRDMCFTVVNRRGGPIHTPGEVVYIKRSKFPEYFQLMERGFDQIMGPNGNPDITDKVIMFSDSGNMWLFTQSAVSSDVATLRHITRTDPLVIRSLD